MFKKVTDMYFMLYVVQNKYISDLLFKKKGLIKLNKDKKFKVGTLISQGLVAGLMLVGLGIQHKEIEDLRDENFAVHKILNNDLEEVVKAQDENNQSLKDDKDVDNSLQKTFEKADPGGGDNASD